MHLTPPFPLDGKSLFQKKLSGIGGYPPPVNRKNLVFDSFPLAAWFRARCHVGTYEVDRVKQENQGDNDLAHIWSWLTHYCRICTRSAKSGGRLGRILQQLWCSSRSRGASLASPTIQGSPTHPTVTLTLIKHTFGILGLFRPGSEHFLPPPPLYRLRLT